MIISSKLIEDAVEQISRLPGVGKKSALRMVLFLLKEEKEQVDTFSDLIKKMRHEIQYCKTCHNISDGDKCSICSNDVRQKHLICVVENIRDIFAIESTQQFNGTYHVLNGLVSPIDGIGPSDLNITSLIERVQSEETSELIMALSPTLEGDTTTFVISKQLPNIKMTALSRGVAFGGELEYADELTLGKSLQNRIPIDRAVDNGK